MVILKIYLFTIFQIVCREKFLFNQVYILTRLAETCQAFNSLSIIYFLASRLFATDNMSINTTSRIPLFFLTINYFFLFAAVNGSCRLEWRYLHFARARFIAYLSILVIGSTNTNIDTISFLVLCFSNSTQMTYIYYISYNFLTVKFIKQQYFCDNRRPRSKISCYLLKFHSKRITEVS